MKARDLTGERFGKLVVISRAGVSGSGGNATWWCQCDCGNTTRTAGTDLRRGRSQTCGCGSREAIRRRHNEDRAVFVGKQFGRLTVIEHIGFNAQQRAVWKCQCTCGSTVETTIHHLQEGSTVSCGCKSREKGPRPNLWSESPGYVAAHGRVKAIHGSASLHTCIDCGGPAQDWSYDHRDPDALTDTAGRPYSTKPEHYQPRCRSCHRRIDSRMATARRVNQEEAQEGARA